MRTGIILTRTDFQHDGHFTLLNNNLSGSELAEAPGEGTNGCTLPATGNLSDLWGLTADWATPWFLLQESSLER